MAKEICLLPEPANYRRLFETAQDGVILLDAKTGDVTDVNPFLINLLGYSREEILGKKLWELGFLKDVEASKAAFKVLQRSGYVRYDNLPLETKEGHPLEVEFVSNVYLVGAQKVIQCNIRDVSERKRVDHLKDDFMSIASHEIRTPLAVVRLGIDDLEAMRGDGDKQAEGEIIAILKRNVERLEKLVTDLLDLSRFGSDKVAPALQTVKIDSLIAGVIQGAQGAAKERGILLRGDYEEDVSLLQADPDLLVRVLTNLLDNALRFAKSKITVKARKVDSNLQVSVINDGPGIKSEDLPTIFDKFVQVDRPREES